MTDSRYRWGGVAWVLTLQFFVVEAIAATRYDGYSYSRDVISALGAGDSPARLLMNGSFVAQGLLIIAGVLLLGPGLAGLGGRLARALLGIAGLGGAARRAVPRRLGDGGARGRGGRALPRWRHRADRAGLRGAAPVRAPGHRAGRARCARRHRHHLLRRGGLPGPR
ncbi:hypothetical protein A7K94_0220855 [Modestobacter sp. VKM Ac-2676]|nr:hypothetical protein A7K94_0220855 [Modestobacter sp. VKM Ac-2676]